jgi:condensin complex subunit 1
MADLVIPSSFEELAGADSSDTNGFGITCFNYTTLHSPEEIEDLISGSLDSIVSANDLSDLPDEINDITFSLVYEFASLSESNKSSFFRLIVTLAEKALMAMNEDDSPGSSKTKCKKYLYYFQHFCIKAEQYTKSSATQEPTKSKAKSGKSKKDTSDSFNWSESRASCLLLLEKIVSSNLSKIWAMGIVQENFLTGIWGYALKLLDERPAGVLGHGHNEVAVRNTCCEIITKSVDNFASPTSSGSYASLTAALLDNTMRSEHMCSHVANICSKTKGKYLIAELIGEISKMNMSKLPGNGVKNVAMFIEEFAKGSPEELHQYFPVLLQQLDSGAHQIRSAILNAMGHLVAHIHQCLSSPEELLDSASAVDRDGEDPCIEDDSDIEPRSRNPAQLTRFRDTLLNMLVERTHDMNIYTRATVLKVWISLLEGGSVPVKNIGSVGEIALDRLRDKNPAVRKHATALMTSAMENNPFSGNLDAGMFKVQRVELQRLFQERVKHLRKVAEAASGGGDDVSGADQVTTVKKTALGVICEDDEEEENEGEGEMDVAAATQGKQSKEAEETADEEFVDSPDVQQDSSAMELKLKIEFCEYAMELIAAIDASVPKITEMLRSKTSSDVVEALKFFRRAVSFNATGALHSFKSAFSLIWHQDVPIRTEVLATFKDVYLTDGAADHSTKLLPPAEVALNLMKLAQNCDDAEVASLEKIIGDLFNEKSVDDNVVKCIWNRVQRSADALDSPASSPADPSLPSDLGSALRIVSMISKCNDSSMTVQRVRLIVQTGLSTSTLQSRDFSSLRAAAQCLVSGPSYTEAFLARSGVSEMQVAAMEAVPMLTTIILGDFCHDDERQTRQWFSVCEEAMHALFHVHPSPDNVMCSVVSAMYSTLSNTNGYQCSASRLSRFLFVLGQTSLSSLVYTEHIANHAKKFPVKGAESEASDSDMEEDPSSADAMEQEMGNAAAADADHERLLNYVLEQDLVVNNLLGRFMPLLSYIVAHGSGSVSGKTEAYAHPLIRESSVLALCRVMSTSAVVCEEWLPLLLTVLQREKQVAVRTSIMIALGDLAFRFPNSIEPWTDRMYDRLADTSPTVRYNTLMVITHLVLNDMIKVKGQVSQVAMSLNDTNNSVRDLARLFFNKLSERSNNPVYNLLGDIIGVFSKDGDDDGRDDKASVKVKEEVAGDNIPTGTAPSSRRVQEGDSHACDSTAEAGLAGLPSSTAPASTSSTSQVSSSSSPSPGSEPSSGANNTARSLSKGEFQSTMHFLLSFVQKDKQADTLLERLVLRMGAATSLKQRRNLAYCISELTITDKGVKKMIELFKNIKDALYDSEIFDAFKKTVSKVKKSTRGFGGAGAAASASEGGSSTTVTKSSLEEFEGLLEGIRSNANGETGTATTANEGGENDDGEEAISAATEGSSNSTHEAVGPSAKASTGHTKGLVRKGAVAKKTAASTKKASRTTKATKSAGTKRGKKVVESSSDEEEEEGSEEEGEDQENCSMQNIKAEKAKTTSRGRRGNSEIML